MNETLIKEAVWCHKMSTEDKYKENHGNAHRYHQCLYELMREMTAEEKVEYHKIILEQSKN